MRFYVFQGYFKMHLVYFMVRLAIHHLKFPGHKTYKHKTQLLYVLSEWSVVKGHVFGSQKSEYESG